MSFGPQWTVERTGSGTLRFSLGTAWLENKKGEQQRREIADRAQSVLPPAPDCAGKGRNCTTRSYAAEVQPPGGLSHPTSTASSSLHYEQLAALPAHGQDRRSIPRRYQSANYDPHTVL